MLGVPAEIGLRHAAFRRSLAEVCLHTAAAPARVAHFILTRVVPSTFARVVAMFRQ